MGLDRQLAGIWIDEDGDELTLSEDGTYSYEFADDGGVLDEGTWSVDGDTLTLTSSVIGEVINTISEDKMTFQDNDGFTFTKRA